LKGRPAGQKFPLPDGKSAPFSCRFTPQDAQNLAIHAIQQNHRSPALSQREVQVCFLKGINEIRWPLVEALRRKTVQCRVLHHRQKRQHQNLKHLPLVGKGDADRSKQNARTQ